MKMTALFPFAAAAVLALPASGATVERAPGDPGAAQQQTLTAWLGCWSAVDGAAPLGVQTGGSQIIGARNAGAQTTGPASLVCVLPGDNAAAVRIATIEDGEVVQETVLSVDGVARAVEEGGCAGTETAAWSQDGRRVFLRTELDCNGIRRESTGVIAFVAENEWVDVQTVSVGGQQASRTLRYRAVPAGNAPDAIAAQLPQDRQMVVDAARLHASAPLDFDAVTEASRTVAAPVVETLIAARRHGFSLNAQRLVQLERAGVPTSTIDMMVAVSYPRAFAVEERPQQQQTFAGMPATYGSGISMIDDCRDPVFRSMSRMECDVLLMRQYNRYGYRGGSYGYGRYGYSPWGYDPYGWNYGNQPIVVIVRPDEGRQRGEAVKGQGYTRGGATSTGRTARDRETTNPQPNVSAGTSSSGASSTSSDTGSSSGTSTGRTAVPRNGGGGGQ